MTRPTLAPVLVLLLLAVAGPAWGQAAAKPAPAHTTAPAAPAPTPAQVQSVLDLLRDDARRAQLITTLEVLSKAAPQAGAANPPGGAPAAAALPLAPGSVGAEVVRGVSQNLKELSADLGQTARAATDFPLIWRWASHLYTDDATRAQVVLTASYTAAALLPALLLEWLARWFVRRPIRALNAHAPANHLDPAAAPPPPGQRRRPTTLTLLRRLPHVLGYLLLQALPLLLFAGIGYGLAATPLAVDETTHQVMLAVVGAYALTRGLTIATRLLVTPDAPRLRLVAASDAAAWHAVRWVRLLAAIAMFGFAGTQVAVLFGLYQAAHDALLKIIMLADHVLLVVIVLRNRAAVAAALRPHPARPDVPAGGAWTWVRERFARVWHLVAIFYIAALWLVWAFEVPDGFARLLHVFFVGAAVLVGTRLALILTVGAVDRAMRVPATVSERYPGLESRASLYHPAARACVRALVLATAALVLLEAWGVDALGWFQGDALGARLLEAAGSIAFTVLLALFVWEAVNAAIQRHLARLARTAQAARSARLRTLLPMLRTTLLVAILIVAGLVVLSDVGVNIAPLLAGAGVLGLAIGFGSQKLVQDIITGLFLLLENTMQVGDVVTLGGLSGTVENLSIRTIRLRALDGAVHIIPFSAVTTVTNMTRDFGYALMDISVGLNEHPDRIVPVLKDIAGRMRDEPRWESAIRDDLDVMGIEKFVDNAWVMRFRIKTLPSQRWAVGREMNRRIKLAFDDQGIESPMTSFRVLSGPPAADAALPKAAE